MTSGYARQAPGCSCHVRSTSVATCSRLGRLARVMEQAHVTHLDRARELRAQDRVRRRPFALSMALPRYSCAVSTSLRLTARSMDTDGPSHRLQRRRRLACRRHVVRRAKEAEARRVSHAVVAKTESGVRSLHLKARFVVARAHELERPPQPGRTLLRTLRPAQVGVMRRFEVPVLLGGGVVLQALPGLEHSLLDHLPRAQAIAGFVDQQRIPAGAP